MDHSPKFYKVQSYYKSNLWTTSMIFNAVIKNWITPAEYEEITTEECPYPIPDGTTQEYAEVGRILMGVEE